ncbi:MAG: HIT family protein [Crocinitomicaceae bacterium]|jgi:histidine triad (HIT) family protein|nr:HIT family protein [Crocinitomicaceae bacterium]
MATLFTRIVNGEIPCYKVAENDKFLAFLDIQPLVKGHVLVIPKIEVDYLFDLEDDLLADMIIFSKNIAKQIKTAFTCKKVGLTVIGLEVPHAHIHLVPINTMSDINFTSPKLVLEKEEFDDIVSRIINS